MSNQSSSKHFDSNVFNAIGRMQRNPQKHFLSFYDSKDILDQWDAALFLKELKSRRESSPNASDASKKFDVLDMFFRKRYIIYNSDGSPLAQSDPDSFLRHLQFLQEEAARKCIHCHKNDELTSDVTHLFSIQWDSIFKLIHNVKSLSLSDWITIVGILITLWGMLFTLSSTNQKDELEQQELLAEQNEQQITLLKEQNELLQNIESELQYAMEQIHEIDYSFEDRSDSEIQFERRLNIPKENYDYFENIGRSLLDNQEN